MRIHAVLIAFALVSCVTLNCQAEPQESAQLSPNRLVELAREYSNSRSPSSDLRATIPTDSHPGLYRNNMINYLLHMQFDDLDEAEREARAGRTRFVGGTWKLYEFYDAVSAPLRGQDAPESDWSDHFARLKAWAAAKPESSAPLIALAASYLTYAYKARGNGYADTVSDTGWQLYTERNAMAAAALVEAAKLKEKSPYWFEAMQQVALAQGWDKSQARELLDAATAFEPDYYHFYREYAYYLLPKWYGEPGDVAAFAEEISNRIGGDKGKFVYFEIASQLRCSCDDSDDDPTSDNLSWPRIKEGYVALGRLYGYSNLKNNRFASMAYRAGDREAAKEAFARIQGNWDPAVWHTGMMFGLAQTWATGQ